MTELNLGKLIKQPVSFLKSSVLLTRPKKSKKLLQRFVSSFHDFHDQVRQLLRISYTCWCFMKRLLQLPKMSKKRLKFMSPTTSCPWILLVLHNASCSLTRYAIQGSYLFKASVLDYMCVKTEVLCCALQISNVILYHQNATD